MNTKTRWLEILLIFALFFLEGAYLVPDVNEAHYLGKAARFWNPSYCPGDFLLSTPDAHGVFVWTFGWLTAFLPLPVCAWLGRIVCWGAMAYFWQKLSWNVAPQRWLSILTAGTLTYFLTNCPMAGEWIFGGMEAKTIAFVFIFWGLERMTAGKWSQTWIVLGIASMFHVLAGGWTVFATLISYIVCLITRQTPFRWRDVLTLPIGGLLSLPGLIPALALNSGADPDIVKTAEHLYVYFRLPHHLLLTAFPTWYICRFGLLCVAYLGVIWLELRVASCELREDLKGGNGAKRNYAVDAVEQSCELRVASCENVQNKNHCTLHTAYCTLPLVIYALSAIGIAIIGVILSLLSRSNPDAYAGLLRFYWFRLSDVAVPMATALLLGGLFYKLREDLKGGNGAKRNYAFDAVEQSCELRVASCENVQNKNHCTLHTAHCTVPFLPICLLALLISFTIWQVDANIFRLANPAPPRQCKMAELDYYPWLDVCKWIDENTPSDSVFIVPKMTRTFSWYAHRGTIVNWKDVPQDAKNLIEWRNRIGQLYVHKDATVPGGYAWDDCLALEPPTKLKALGKKYGANYLVTNARTPIALPILYQNRQFTVYRLETEDSLQRSSTSKNEATEGIDKSSFSTRK